MISSPRVPVVIIFIAGVISFCVVGDVAVPLVSVGEVGPLVVVVADGASSIVVTRTILDVVVGAVSV